MRLLVNTLSIGSLSGQHVVYGFLRPLAQWMLPEHEMMILHYASQRPPADLLDAGVTTIALPERERNWARRTLWEATRLPGLVRSNAVDLVLTASGAISPRCPVPQVSLAQNPWCYVRSAHWNSKDRMKAWLQRVGYRKAFRNAAMMIYISNHLQSLYRRDNPQVAETNSEVAYVGLNEATFQTARSLASVPRDPWSILSVSAFAPWKGVETVVQAVALLRQQGIPATLKLVGPWPHAAYEQRVRRLITEHELHDAITIYGQVSSDELHMHYATSRVFCLMSCCESFGIPAAEAMAFGTPIVSTDCCAIAEICASAGQFGPLADPEWTARALRSALTDHKQWQRWSENAVNRAATLTWERCARPFQRICDLVERDTSATPSNSSHHASVHTPVQRVPLS
jgi:glycosyltransferase involved in cell wall biosynthesis